MFSFVPTNVKHYPGELATPEQVFLLAEQYRSAAVRLLEQGKPRRPLSRAPFRLVAIHAIELHLNAFLLHCGKPASDLRGLQHNLQSRLDLAEACGLKLRLKTRQHVVTLVDTREYLVTRYGPELASNVSQINRLTATLEEVAKKVAVLMARPAKPVPVN